MTIFLGFWLVIVLQLFWAGTGLANVGILVDASGSMAGFFATGEIHRLYDWANGAVGPEAQGIYFKNRGELTPYEVPGSSDGQTTCIDLAFQSFRQRYPNSSGLWLITDNIQDPQGAAAEQDDFQRFYAALRQPAVKKVYLFPGKLRFNGKIYQRDGRSLLGMYEGDRGLIAYFILLQDQDETKFEEQAAGFARASSWPKILAKPLSGGISLSETVTPTPSGKKHHKLTFNPATREISSATIFREGDPVIVSFQIDFRSHLRHISLRQPEIKVEPLEHRGATPFRSEDVRLETSGGSFADLSPGDTDRKLRVLWALDKGVKFSTSWRDIFRYMFTTEMFSFKPGDYYHTIRLSVVAPNDRIVLENSLWDQYGTGDERYFSELSPVFQEKIFGLDRLFQGVFHDFQQSAQTLVASQDYKIHFRVIKPRWPFFLAILGWLLLLCLAVGMAVLLVRLIRSWSREPYYLVEPPDCKSKKTAAAPAVAGKPRTTPSAEVKQSTPKQGGEPVYNFKVYKGSKPAEKDSRRLGLKNDLLCEHKKAGILWFVPGLSPLVWASSQFRIKTRENGHDVSKKKLTIKGFSDKNVSVDFTLVRQATTGKKTYTPSDPRARSTGGRIRK